MSLLFGITLGALALGCEPSARSGNVRTTPEEIHARMCEVVVASYFAGARPTALEVELPGLRGERGARALFVGEHIPLAEACLGLPMPEPQGPRATERSLSGASPSPRSSKASVVAPPEASGSGTRGNPEPPPLDPLQSRF